VRVMERGGEVGVQQKDRHTDTYTHTYTYRHGHTHTHTHIHIQTQAQTDTHTHTWSVGEEEIGGKTTCGNLAGAQLCPCEWNGLDICGLRLRPWVDNKAVGLRAWLGANVLEPVAAHAHGKAGKVEDGRGLARTAAADEGDDRPALKFLGALHALFDEADGGGNAKGARLLQDLARLSCSHVKVVGLDRGLEVHDVLGCDGQEHFLLDTVLQLGDEVQERCFPLLLVCWGWATDCVLQGGERMCVCVGVCVGVWVNG